MADSLETADEHIRLEYVPRPGLGRLAILNFLLNLIALSIYHFWAKTNVRQIASSQAALDGNGENLGYAFDVGVT